MLRTGARLLPTAIVGFAGAVITLFVLFAAPTPPSAWVPAIIAGVVAGLVGRGWPGTLGLLIGEVLGIATATALYLPLAWYPDWLLAFVMLEIRAATVMFVTYVATRLVAGLVERRRPSPATGAEATLREHYR